MAKHFGDRIIEDFMGAGESVKAGIGPRDVNSREFQEGVHVEMEHTTDPVISAKIGLDHLAEHDAYYTALSVMEQILKHDRLDEFLDWADTGLGIKPKLRKLPRGVFAKLRKG
jgi:hypothetical protein